MFSSFNSSFGFVSAHGHINGIDLGILNRETRWEWDLTHINTEMSRFPAHSNIFVGFLSKEMHSSKLITKGSGNSSG